MNSISSTLLKVSTPTKTDIQKQNFWHLYWDIAGYGLLQGSTLAFLVVFATRLGASSWQIGLLTAGPAIINIILTLPAGQWLTRQDIHRTVVWTAFLSRLGYFLLIPLPFIATPSTQIWLVLLMVVVISIPGTILAIAFNGLLATVVSPEFRGEVVGKRNALLSATTMLTYFMAGFLLDYRPFEQGYLLVFLIGALGSGISTYHLACLQINTKREYQFHPMGDHARVGRPNTLFEVINHRLSISPRLWLSWQSSKSQLGHISNQYWWAMAAFFSFHFTQMLLVPVHPVFLVREMTLSDGQISLLNVAFYLTVLMVSPQLAFFTTQYGNHRLAAGGALLLSLYPLLNGLVYSFYWLLVANVVGGMIWAILSGALTNRLLELTPDADRAYYLAIYNLALNIAIFSSAILASAMLGFLSAREVLLIIFVLRVGSGLCMWRWG